ncbi:MAG: hypothetical protein N2595_08095 [bacterium]|nr:hypothetical protein [bacterium]
MEVKVRRHLWALVGIAGVVVIVFHSVLLPPKAVVANDSPLASIARAQRWWREGRRVVWLNDGYLGRSGGRLALSIQYPLQRLVKTEYYNTVLFAGATLMVGIGMYGWCVTLGLGVLASFVGACALMLSGDFITCVFSGHGGKFLMWGFLLWSLWLLTYGVRERSVLALVWSGICGGIGVSNQLDVGFIVGLFYVAWLAFLVWRTRGEGRGKKLVTGLGMAAAAGSVYAILTVVWLLGLATQGERAIAAEQRGPVEQWNWATQWSLPKAETLTLLVPGFYGWGHLPDAPYWGRIGQDARWVTEHVGFARFSINTQGLGVVVIALAVLGICRGLTGDVSEEGRKGLSGRAVIQFWAIAALVGLLFAWGRYFDTAPNSARGLGAYRLFYALPGMSAMRNPLKFLYPVMLGVAVLAGYGMETLQEIIMRMQGHTKGMVGRVRR